VPAMETVAPWSRAQKREMKANVKDMFYHAYDKYVSHVFYACPPAFRCIVLLVYSHLSHTHAHTHTHKLHEVCLSTYVSFIAWILLLCIRLKSKKDNNSHIN
jgi:hypothetical protein